MARTRAGRRAAGSPILKRRSPGFACLQCKFTWIHVQVLQIGVSACHSAALVAAEGTRSMRYRLLRAPRGILNHLNHRSLQSTADWLVLAYHVWNVGLDWLVSCYGVPTTGLKAPLTVPSASTKHSRLGMCGLRVWTNNMDAMATSVVAVTLDAVGRSSFRCLKLIRITHPFL